MGLVDYTTLKFWEKPLLNYNWYWVLAVFFGWCALDQLYIGSPQTFILKIIVNVFTLGYWWFYDALNATFNQPQVKLFGPSIPAYGPIGMAGGRFADDSSVSDKEKDKHANMIIYSIILLTMAVIGGDSFLTGDTMSGVIRIIALFSIVFTPIALIWAVYKIYQFFFDPKGLLEQNWDYFGAPQPTDKSKECPNVLETFTAWIVDTTGAVMEYIPILNRFAPFVRGLAESLRTAYGIVKTTVETTVETVKTTAKAVDAVQSAMAATSPSAITAEGLKAAAAEEATKQAERAAATAATAATAANAATIVGGARQMMGGGGNILSTAINPMTALGLVAVVSFVIVSGLMVYLRRSIQESFKNEQQRRDKNEDDVPPEPAAA